MAEGTQEIQEGRQRAPECLSSRSGSSTSTGWPRSSRAADASDSMLWSRSATEGQGRDRSRQGQRRRVRHPEGHRERQEEHDRGADGRGHVALHRARQVRRREGSRASGESGNGHRRGWRGPCGHGVRGREGRPGQVDRVQQPAQHGQGDDGSVQGDALGRRRGEGAGASASESSSDAGRRRRMASKLKIRQIKSAINRSGMQKKTIRALGIRSLHQMVVHDDNPRSGGWSRRSSTSSWWKRSASSGGRHDPRVDGVQEVTSVARAD